MGKSMRHICDGLYHSTHYLHECFVISWYRLLTIRPLLSIESIIVSVLQLVLNDDAGNC